MSIPVVEDVLAYPRPPTLPGAALGVIDRFRGTSMSDPDDLIAIAQYDQGLTTSVLRRANAQGGSGAASSRRLTASLRRALTMLGSRQIRTILLDFDLLDVRGHGTPGTRACPDPDYPKRMVWTVAAARHLRRLVQPSDAEVVHAAALLRDVGVLAMHWLFGREYEEAVAAADGAHRRLPLLEEQAFGFTHAQAGACLALHWRLPRSVAVAIADHHHDLDDSSRGGRDRHAAAVQLADLAASTLIGPGSSAMESRFRRAASDWFDISSREATRVLSTLASSVDELAWLWRDPTALSPAEMLEQATQLRDMAPVQQVGSAGLRI